MVMLIIRIVQCTQIRVGIRRTAMATAEILAIDIFTGSYLTRPGN